MIVNVYNACSGGLGTPVNLLSPEQATLFRKVRTVSHISHPSLIQAALFRIRILLYLIRRNR